MLATRMESTISATPVSSVSLDAVTIQKMAFVYNAVQQGWSVRKLDEAYVFSKKHQGKKEIFLDDYLRKFVTDNLDIEALSR